jgi:predicted acetyltransferase
MNNSIRYLSAEERQKTKSMYEEIFIEDSKSFVDYYYQYKTLDNQILVLEDERGQILAMIHLNPFRACLGKAVVSINYIVAVATASFARKQGKMTQVMRRSLMDLYQVGQPFTFLMPENPPVYHSAGFRFIKNSVNKMLPAAVPETTKARQESGVKVRFASAKDAAKIAVFVNQVLEMHYDLFIQRDENYYIRMLHELGSCAGKIILAETNNILWGVFCYGNEYEKIEIKEAIFQPDKEDCLKTIWEEMFAGKTVVFQEMKFMGRILDLSILGELLKSTTSYHIKVQVTDAYLSQNCGGFEIKVDPKGSCIKKIPTNETVVAMDIGELAEFLFGKMHIFLNEWV